MFWSKSPADKLLEILPQVKGKYKKEEPLSKYTWFAVGGPAEVMFFPENEDDLAMFLKTKPYNVPVFVIGAGSNLLVRDGGITGVVIKLDNKNFKKIDIQNDTITVGAGLRNGSLEKTLIEKGIGGLEFLCSIPGVIGGSVKTNAGCYGKEVKDVIVSATIVNGLGEQKTISVDDLKLSYRNSLFPDDWIITSITFKYTPKESEKVAETIADIKEKRAKSQPHNVKTAGSTFKNPEGLKAWELIKKSGCENLNFNGAVVSDQHCNFLVNTGSATAKDIENLGEEIIKKVKEKTSITLEWEVKRVGIDKK